MQNKIKQLLQGLKDKINSIDESMIPESFLQEFINRRNFVQGLTGNEELEISISQREEEEGNEETMYYEVYVHIKDNYIGAVYYKDSHNMNMDIAGFNTNIFINN